MKCIKNVCCVVIGAAVLLALMPKALAEDILKVAVPQQHVWQSAASELGQQAGIFKKHGVVLEFFHVQGSSEVEQHVISGKAEVGLGVSAMAAMRDYAFGAPIMIIGATMTGGTNYWYVLKSSPIHNLKEVAGKTIAYATNGSSSHYDAIDFMKEFSLKAKLVPTGGLTATFDQLKSGYVDVAWATPPFGLDEIERGNIRVVARANDIPRIRDKTVSVMITNAGTLQERKDALTRFLQAYRETVEWMYSDPAAAQRYAELAGVSEGVARRLRDEFFTKDMLWPDKIGGLGSIVRDAVVQQYLSRRLSSRELKSLIQMPAPRARWLPWRR
jgi:NitT/TauT family transport system substrate-binding protein